MSELTQWAHPIIDVDVSQNSGGSDWSPTPVWLQLYEAVPDDGDTEVTSAENPGAFTFTVKLQPLAWPKSGPQKLTVRLRWVDPTGEELALVELLQGNLVIASTMPTLSGSYSDVVLTLTDAQKSLITDYTELRVRVSAIGDIEVDCCSNTVNPRLTATLESSCSSINGKKIHLTYHAVYDDWSGHGELCDEDATGDLVLKCGGQGCSQFQLESLVSQCLNIPFTHTADACTCDPLNLRFDDVGYWSSADPDCDCCEEAHQFSVVVTEYSP